MITRHLAILFCVLLSQVTNAQPRLVDSLTNVLSHATADIDRYEACRLLYNYYEESSRDSALSYAEQMLSLSQRNGEKLPEVLSLDFKAYQLLGLGKYATSLQCLLQAFKIAEDPRYEKEKTWTLSNIPSPGKERLLMLALTHHMLAILMWQTGNIEQQIAHFREARTIGKEINNQLRLLLASMNLGNSYVIINKLDSALLFEKEAEALSMQPGREKYRGYIYSVLGEVYLLKGNIPLAKEYFYKGIETSSENKNLSSLSRNYFRLARYYISIGEKDSALFYSLKHLHNLQSLGQVLGLESNMGTSYENVYYSYQLQGNPDSTFKYQGLALAAIDSLSKLRIKNLAEFQNVNFGEQLRLQQVEREKIAYQNRVRTYFLLAGIAILLLLAAIFYKNNRQKHRAKQKIEQAYDNLKATQQQLIQSEKMASLGELTAGIAHEIQNPLNFVNNFSEVNSELVDELKSELATGNVQSAIEIANNIKDNQQKINHHGNRADAIVKGMLQHSRSGSGLKEPTDLNTLVDEYLRLAYHGLRAKDKSFNARFETSFDNSIGKVNVVAQDIGRVILNLINNAFYAVSEKQKQASTNSPSTGSGAYAYEPTVTVSTKKINGKVELRVTDNGNGVPQKILDKIFQPFFTTKPTGEGTGLGLSLSYDIITKGHGGEIRVNTKENKGTEFTIVLPS